jgi:cytidine deaminase
MKEIVEASRSAASSAYVPYSGHSIGAAIVTPEGDTYTGCNIEVSGLSSSIHAEETAVMKAIKDGESEFNAISISSEGGVTPCGMCRQTLSEFCEGDLIVIVDSTKQDEVRRYRLSDLYPDRFTYAELQR